MGGVGAPKRRPQRAGRRAAPQGDGQRARLGLGVVRSAGRGRRAPREGLERRNTTAHDEEGAVALREHMCSTTAPPGETVRSSSGGEASQYAAEPSADVRDSFLEDPDGMAEVED